LRPLRKITIITSHPIQYNAPFFRMLSGENEIELKVFYSWGEKALKSKYDPDFGRVVEWDIPLLEGYDYHLTRNVAKKPGSDHFWGIITPDLISEINAFKPDVIWVWGWSFYSHLKVMRSFKGKIPIWFRGDSIVGEHKSDLKSYLRKKVLTWIYKNVDKAFYVGQLNKSYYLHFGLKENQLIKAYHSIDNLRFSEFTLNDELALYQLKEQLDIKSNEFVLLYAGKLEPRKNPNFLSLLAKRLENEKYKIIIVGNGPLENELKSKIVKLKHVKFLDFQNQTQMPIIYRLANLYLLPSLSETWGLGMNEALACGVPVAASIYCGGSADLIDENNGFVFDPKDGVESFVDKLTNFTKQPNTDFRAKFLKEFNYQRIVDVVLKELN
jgi:glycosyltransferase involved in cell wall biosynthesis